MPLAVNERSPAVVEMSAEWQLVDDLLGGTRGMRAAGERRLPKWPNEQADAYRTRLSTATLFPAFRRTLGVMAGKPFAKEVTLGEAVPPKLVEWCEDVDMQGRNLHSFCADLMVEAIGYGIAGVLVDYPPATGVRTLADERAAGARPYFVHIRHDQILGWRAKVIGGVLTLTQLRLRETATEEDGPYGEKNIEQVRVLEPGKWEIHRKVGDTWALHEEGTTTLRVIPFVPCYGRRLGFMTGESPLIDLAHLNVKHWQSQSDQDTLLHVARVPILTAIGVDEGFELTVGASAAIKISNPDGKLEFVEHSGAAIGAGAESLKSLEEQMIQTGAELLVAKPGQRTATEASNDAEANKSELQAIVENFEDSIDMALYLMAQWVGLEDGGSVSLFKDFSAGSLSEASAQLIVAMQQTGLITKATALREQQRRGVLAADIDVEAELEEVEAEGPALGGLDDGDT